MYDYDWISIGSGPAGQRAAVQAAKLGRRTAIIERGLRVGGICLQKGTIPSKALREAVIIAAGAASRANAARPTVPSLLSRVEDVQRIESEIIEDQLRRNRVDILYGDASFASPFEITVHKRDGSSQQVSAAHAMIAVGTRPAIPAGVTIDHERVLTSDDLRALKQLPRAMCIVGGGVIGIEYASMAATLGVEVTLIERRQRLLEFCDDELVDELVYHLRRRNVTFRLGESVAEVRNDGERVHIILDSGKKVVSDAVLFSSGRTAATDSLNLAAIGIPTGERGYLRVDDNFRTAQAHIYAAGDVIGYPSLASTSMEQGRLAACDAFGVSAKMATHFPIGIYAIPELSFVGQTERALTAAKIPYETGIARYREIARGQILGDDTGFFKMLFHRETRLLLGVHAIGTGATELIHIGQAVLGLGGGLDYFLETVFNYPTLAECYKTAALHAANKLNQT